jgi:hypothetical protein
MMRAFDGSANHRESLTQPSVDTPMSRQVEQVDIRAPHGALAAGAFGVRLPRDRGGEYPDTDTS